MVNVSLSRIVSTFNGVVQKFSTTQPHTQPPEKPFFPFEDLPKELRQAIWEFAHLEPRILFLRPEQQPPSRRAKLQHYMRHKTHWRPYYSPRVSCKLCPNTPAPTLILTCKEALEVANKLCTRKFSPQVFSPLAFALQAFFRHLFFSHFFSPHSMFNYNQDTLYIHLGAKLFQGPRLVRIEVSWVRYLAVYDYDTRSREQRSFGCIEDWLAQIILTFGNLDKLTVVVAQIHDCNASSTFVLKVLKPIHSRLPLKFPGFNNAFLKEDLSEAHNWHFRPELVEDFLVTNYGVGVEFLDRLPRIEFQIMLAPQYVERFDETERTFRDSSR